MKNEGRVLPIVSMGSNRWGGECADQSRRRRAEKMCGIVRQQVPRV